MKRINLRDYYPDYYSNDYIIEVPDEIADVMAQSKKSEQAYQRRVRYHHAQYSLDLSTTVEYDAVFRAESPMELYERKLTMEQLYAALSTLPSTQARRIHAYFFLNQTMEEIATREGVSKSSISESINRALRHIKRYMQQDR